MKKPKQKSKQYGQKQSRQNQTAQKKIRKITPAIYWAPRIMSIGFILFISLFALDIFSMNLGFFGIIIGLFMHLIPSFVLIAILIVAWKHEWVGSIAFTLAGLAYIGLLLMNDKFEWYMLSWSIIIAGPAFLIGFLFWKNWTLKRKK